MSHKCNYFILTGAMGAGKSTILKALKKQGLVCIDEPVRQILAEQRAIGGDGVPERNPKLFTELLLSRSIHQFKQMEGQQGPVIYDRGIPDNISYAKLFGLDLNPYTKAAGQYQYNKHIFFLPAWEKIYQNDDERKMTFEQARQFGEDIKKRYKDLGYGITDIPMHEPSARAEFIIHEIMKNIEIHDPSPGTTLPDCQLVLEELKQREPIFHKREYGTSREAIENMTTSSFWEVGASGKRYSRKYVIELLLERYSQQAIDDFETENWATKDFCCQKISSNSYLLTYTLIQGTRITRRATIWRYENETWKIAYHQGTIVEALP